MNVWAKTIHWKNSTASEIAEISAENVEILSSH